MQTATGSVASRAALYSKRGTKGPAKTRRKPRKRTAVVARETWRIAPGAERPKGKAPATPAHKVWCQCKACRTGACDVTD